MKIVIVGAGGIGTCLVRLLTEEHHEITIIDTKPEVVETLTDRYEVNGICGSGASYSVLKKAGLEATDVFLAVTSTDEANIMACMIAKELGAGYTIARVRERVYLDDVDLFREKAGIDQVINPELALADEIERLLKTQLSANVQSFMDGNVLLTELNITEHHRMAGLSLVDLHKEFGISMLVATVTRDKKAFVPSGSTVLQPGDKISVLAQTKQMERLLKELKVVMRTVKRVMMVGCDSSGEYLVEKLQKLDMKIKIIEFDKDRCLELARLFPEVTIAYADSLDEKLLSEEGLADYDACVSLCPEDGRNLVVSMFAWSLKVPKIITKVLDVSYASVLENVDLDNTVSPYEITASNILRYVRGLNSVEKEDSLLHYIRGLNNTEHAEHLQKLYRMSDNQAEVLELSAEGFTKYGVRLMDPEFKTRPGILVATIIRNGVVSIANGKSTIEPDDEVIVVSTAAEKLHSLNDILVP